MDRKCEGRMVVYFVVICERNWNERTKARWGGGNGSGTGPVRRGHTDAANPPY